LTSSLATSLFFYHIAFSGVKGNHCGYTDLSDEAALLRTLDVFCAKTSPQLHYKPMSGTQAARAICFEKGMASDNPFIQSLVKEIGVHPPGSFVKLINSKGVHWPNRYAATRRTRISRSKTKCHERKILITVNTERIWVESPIHRYG